MDLLPLLGAVIIGFLAGFGAALLTGITRTKTAREVAAEVLRESEEEHRSRVDGLMDQVKAAFGALSLDALSRSTEEFLKLAKVRLEAERQAGTHALDARKGLIDQQLERMSTQLNDVSRLMKELEKDRVEKFGELSNHLRIAGEQTAVLAQTTGSLREALVNTRARGQWGERMAEDVLRIAGFKESVNYTRQKTIDGSGCRPDFTFFLPRGLKLNMDVKFPFDNYMRFLEAASDGDRARFRSDFLKDVKAKIKEVTTRDYINPGQNTMDCVLLFIPNEQVYGFIQEQDGLLFEDGLKNHVICCSPTTLFAVLAVIRQALDAFSLEETSNEVLSSLGAFKKQWDEFLKKLESMGRRIGDLQREYDTLTSTRRRQLERPLNRIEEIRRERGLVPAPAEGEAAETEGSDDREA